MTRPTFHKNGEVTWYSPRYRRKYRTHPTRIPRPIVSEFNQEDFEKWKKLAPEKALAWFR